MTRIAHAHFIESLKDVSLNGRIALITGGSAGIGAATAIKLASLGASVTVVGRSDSKCKAVVEQMKSVSPASSNAVLTYALLDFGDLKATESFLESYAADTPRLDFLVLSAGGFSGNDSMVTPDCSRAVAVNYVSRFAAVKYLAPLLTRTAELSQDGIVRVINVGNPTLSGTSIDGFRDDMGMVKAKGISWFLKLPSLVTYANVMIDEFAKQNPKVAMIHIHPGVIATDLQAPFPINFIVVPIVKLVGDSVEYAGDRIAFYLTKYDCTGRFGRGIYIGMKDEDVPFNWTGDVGADYETVMKFSQRVLDQAH
ncbi:hypothetical protein BJ742DRAFT_807234 [Cladochytrium replicatum]|nr:hypothetical protein BJ742DRAFT_807234 [Cladochytrium replicatum]